MQPMICSASFSDSAIHAGKALPLLLLAALACSSVDEPDPPVRLLVENETCDPGPCELLEVLAFPDSQPHTPGGFWSVEIGVVSTASTCITLPASATFSVVAVTPVGTGADTTTYTWTTADAVALAAQPLTSSLLMAAPTTEAFVPATSPGWRVALPGGSQVSPTEACTP